MFNHRLFLTLPLLILNTLPVYAESDHVQELDLILISTPLGQSTANSALPVSILTGDNLRMKASSTVGETLKDELGISNQSFGPGVGRPVIRGQSGSRVHVLQNGLGSLDVSSLSPDHANSTQALWAERIEVLKGPTTLLYGSGAIGGIVNVLDNRIPNSVPDARVQGAFEQRYNTVNEGKSSAFKLDGGKDNIAWHLDGFYRDSIDLQVPVNDGRLNNTNTRARSGTAGFSFIGKQGFIGLSANHMDSTYGIPSNEHEHEHEEQIRINQKQTRYDMKAEINEPLPFAEKLRLRLGYNDYQHIEIENGEAGTLFSNKGFESRLELIQKPWAFFDHGVLGMQTKNSRFSALGHEAVVPITDIDSVGFFSVQDIHTEHITYQFGLRVEQQWMETALTKTSHTPVSFSTSALWSVTDEDSIKLTFSRSQRAPDVQELFANGAHHGTQSFEIGDSTLNNETSHNIELGFHIDHDWFQADINLFQNWVNDYITPVNSGLLFSKNTESVVNNCVAGDECLAIFNAQQQNAIFHGFEAQINIPLMETSYGNMESQLFSDYVRGQFTEGNDIPRMPPLRYGMQLSWNNPDWSSKVRITRAESQDNSGLNETETAGYWLLDLSANYRLNITDHAEMLLFVKANNLLDSEIRNSVSYLRNIAPEAGRGAEMGIRIEF